MILSKNISNVYSRGNEIQRVFSYGKLVWERVDFDDDITVEDCFTVKAVDDEVYVRPIGMKSGAVDYISYRYSRNGGDWVDVDYNTKSFIRLTKNETLSIIANYTIKVIISGLSDIYGNIQSLVVGSEYATNNTWYSSYPAEYISGLPDKYEKFNHTGFFSNCDVRDASKLLLPANISNTTRAYCAMFRSCTSLTQAPVLPATKLGDVCYNVMFDSCYALKKAPELPATTLDNSCYSGMFANCTSLTQAPELPATTLKSDCYSGMFANCTSLTQAPELPATTLKSGCYGKMFYKCNKLNYIKCLATPDKYDTGHWVDGVSPTGTFVAKKGTNWTRDVSGIPENWTVEYI